jgi:hypothetical protein
MVVGHCGRSNLAEFVMPQILPNFHAKNILAGMKYILAEA